ncbi:MAG: biopolymer transporter ExbD [Pseudomonadota bacterium]
MINRRMKRMSRARERPRPPSIMLTSLMDIFTVLVLYLLVNQQAGADISPPKAIKLPDSVVEAQPRPTVVMLVSGTEVLIDGEPVVTVAEVNANRGDYVEPVRVRMLKLKKQVIGLSAQALADSTEVTIMADRGVPFKVLKKLMSSSSSAGYTKISLAVNQK